MKTKGLLACGNDGEIFTITEIMQQPITWIKTWKQINNLSLELKKFLVNVTKQKDFDIIFSGAGSSEFVGNAAASALCSQYNYHLRSVSSTNIVSSPKKYLSLSRPTLLVSFARSGDSPESIGAVKAVDEICKWHRHLFITCNPNGVLALSAKDRSDCYCIELSPEINDRGFAMTSSFSNMYLAAICIFQLFKINAIKRDLDAISIAGKKCIDSFEMFEKLIYKRNFTRFVYLGTAELSAIAQEAALKMLELTSGKAVAVCDTPLGFRHGPKSIINDDTLTIFFLSDESHQRLYEIDMLKEMYTQKKKNCLMLVANNKQDDVKDIYDEAYFFEHKKRMSESILSLNYILIAQMLAVAKSRSLGIKCDNPCPTGEVNRVVQGVTIYPVC